MFIKSIQSGNWEGICFKTKLNLAQFKLKFNRGISLISINLLNGRTWLFPQLLGVLCVCVHYDRKLYGRETALRYYMQHMSCLHIQAMLDLYNCLCHFTFSPKNATVVCQHSLFLYSYRKKSRTESNKCKMCLNGISYKYKQVEAPCNYVVCCYLRLADNGNKQNTHNKSFICQVISYWHICHATKNVKLLRLSTPPKACLDERYGYLLMKQHRLFPHQNIQLHSYTTSVLQISITNHNVW